MLRASAGPASNRPGLVPASDLPLYAGVAETSVYVGDGFRGRGVGKALTHRQVAAADARGASPAPRVWRDTVFLERRRSAD
jgi:L-amino acid N-acyltransferase YncA